MPHRTRRISFLERTDHLKHYGVATHRDAPSAALAAATRSRGRDVVPAGAYGFTIAHDAATAGLGLVYWWANDNELHHRSFAAPLDDPGALTPADGTAWPASGSSR